MTKIINGLMNAIETVVTILLGLEVITIVAQIFFRYVLRAPLSWSDQACRFGLVWIIMLGVPVMFNRKATVAFDLIFQKTTGKTRTIFEIFFDLCGLFFGITFFLCSLQYVQKSGKMSVPGFPGLKFWMLYSAEVSCGALLSVVMIKDLFIHILKLRKQDLPSNAKEP